MSKRKNGKRMLPAKEPWEEISTQHVIIPDDLIYYVISNYLQGKHTTGVSIVTGVSTQTVEDILQLVVDWGSKTGNIKDGVLHLGEKD